MASIKKKSGKLADTKRKTEKETGKKKKVLEAKDIFAAAAKNDFTNEEATREFESLYKSSWEGKKPGNQILFLVANEDEWPDTVPWTHRKTEEFLTWILKRYHSLLEIKVTKRPHNMSPLLLALSENNNAFVNTVLNYPMLMNIDTVLPESCYKGNALHVAVRHSQSSIDLLVDKCAKFPTMFEEKELETGNTPLHTCMSLELGPGGEEEEEEEGGSVSNSSSDEDYQQESESTSDMVEESDDEVEDHGETPATESHPDKHFVHLPSRTFSLRADASTSDKVMAVAIVEKLVTNYDPALAIRNREGLTPYQERISVLRNNLMKRNKEESAVLEKKLQEVVAEDPIANFIRSYCIRNFSREEIMRCLYITGQERHIEFDLGGLRNNYISDEYLNQLSRHLRFESILKYVALPNLTLEAPLRRKRERNTPAHKSKRGRSDLVTVFQWLRDNYVKKIVKVIVVDDQDPCHADSSIEQSLKDFEVEIWDWKRLDLCVDVISNSSKVIREVSLYSSGNNAVLMGWASPQGLLDRKKFPKLERVRLYIREGYEDKDRLTKYIDDFKATIHQQSHGKIAVTHILDDGDVSHASDFQSNAGYSQPENQWLDCVSRFAKLLENVPTSQTGHPVKIAIIDDGVDASMMSLDGKIATGKSFSPYANSTDLISPYFVSSSNHGTCMAMLITRLCPMVQLYVARLDQRQSSGTNSLHMTPKSAAEAIRWATECSVDIISMSWTIETPVPGNPEMKSLEEAVKAAEQNNILMFCSTSDQGSMTRDYCYPGDFGGCIKIGSATNTGDAMTWVNVAKVDFLMPGTNVPFSNNEGKAVSHESGSSVATAAASGLAGVLLYASWVLKNNDTYFKDYKNMASAFKNLAFNDKFPRVSDRLEKRFKEALAREKNSEIEAFHDLSKLTWDQDCVTALEQVILRVKETS